MTLGLAAFISPPHNDVGRLRPAVRLAKPGVQRGEDVGMPNPADEAIIAAGDGYRVGAQVELMDGLAQRVGGPNRRHRRTQ